MATTGTTTKGKGKRTGKGRTDSGADGFTKEEREAIKERAKELRATTGGAKAAQAEADVLAKIAEMPEADRALAERVHAIVMASAPELAPRTWYGMPAYAKDGKVLCFFQGAAKFSSRYSTLGFNDPATLDDGEMWATTFAVTAMTDAVEERIAALVRQAVS